MRIALIRYGFFHVPVRREAKSLASRGDAVDVFILRHPEETKRERVDGAMLHRLMVRHVDEKSLVQHVFKHVRFLLLVFWHATLKSIRERYDVVHVYVPPDYLIFAVAHLRWFGTRIILENLDMMPEFFLSKFGGKEGSPVFRGLLFLERIASTIADHVITVTHAWKDTLVERSVPQEKCSVLLNVPDLTLFSKEAHPRRARNKVFTMMYHGHLGVHSGVDTGIRAVSLLKGRMPRIRFDVYGLGQEFDRLMALREEVDVQDHVRLHGRVPIAEIPGLISRASLGLDPKHDGLYADGNVSMKVFEYFAMDCPAVVSRRRGMEYYFDDDTVAYYTAGDAEDLARCIETLYKHPRRIEAMRRNAGRFLEAHSWDTYRRVYWDLMDSLAGNHRNALQEVEPSRDE